ncbi:MAG: bifunctional oligoribonuclease/PAP phosphatase NrnA [bacterium]|nr:bifunctional oligoribonuclease/PAP phosphatase NrnA [bacterium]
MNFEQIAQEIQKGERFLITSHVYPDGDALGSMLALAAGIKSMGKSVKLYNRDGAPQNLSFLPGAAEISKELKPDEEFDAAFIVDCAERERAGEAFCACKGIKKIIVIDHHVKSGRAGDINLIDPAAPSTGDVILRLLGEMKIPIGSKIAINVYCTLVADTGGFRYSNTDANVLRTAADLVEKGASPWTVARNLFENFPVSRLKALGLVLQTLEVEPKGRYAFIVVTLKMLKEAGATTDVVEGFINFPRSIETTEVAIQFREEASHKYKVSFRSKDRVDVAALAAQFGGGGHVRASGCTIEGTLTEVKKKIIAAVEKAL